MSYIYTESTILLVKAASFPQSMQTADSFVTISAIGTRLRILPNGFLWKVPSSAATMTIFPLLASASVIYTISVKNCPSSMATTSCYFAFKII
jgi:hypothetical protein